MKLLNTTIAMAILVGSAHFAKAQEVQFGFAGTNSCSQSTTMTFGAILMATITSAPTGTSAFLTGMNCPYRDTLIALKEDAISAKIAGTQSIALQQAIQNIQAENSSLSESSIIEKLAQLEIAQ